MGEIADALRRARLLEGGGGLERSPAPPRTAVDRSLEVRPPPPRASREECGLDQLSPVDPAIVIEDGPNLETCRRLAVRLRATIRAGGLTSVAIVSALRNEGKTTVLCDLGLALASLSSQREVAIVDLDLRNPSIARVLDLPARRGVEDVLLGRAALDDICISVKQPELDIFPAVVAQRASHELLVLPAFARLVSELERRYSVVLFDTPPALLVPDANLILQQVGAAIPIARAGQTRVRAFRQLIEQLPEGRILGELLNGVSAPSASYYYYGEDSEGEAAPSKRRRAEPREPR